MTAFPKRDVFQWRVSNNEAAKKFLGSLYGGVYKRSPLTVGVVGHLFFYNPSGRTAHVAPSGYIIRTATGRFVPVDQEIYERLAE